MDNFKSPQYTELQRVYKNFPCRFDQSESVWNVEIMYDKGNEFYDKEEISGNEPIEDE